MNHPFSDQRSPSPPSPFAPPTTTAPKRRTRWEIGLIIGFGLLVGGIVLLQQAEPLPNSPEDPAEREQHVRAAFALETTEVTSPESEGIRAVIARFGHLVDTGNVQDMDSHFDSHRMLRQIETSGLNRRLRRSERSVLLEHLRDEFRNRMMESLDIDRFAIRRLQFNSDRGEAVAYITLWDRDGMSLRTRWWLILENDAWRVFDFEDLEMESQFCKQLVDAMNYLESPGVDVEAVIRNSEIWLQLKSNIDELDLDTLRSQLDRIQVEHLVPFERVSASVLMASLHQAEGDYEQMLARYADVPAQFAHIPGLSYIRAPALHALGRYEEAIAEATRFVDRLGYNETISLILGESLRSLDRDEEAREVFRKGLDDSPDSADLIVSFGLSLPPDELDELRARFLAMSDPGAHLETLAEAFMEWSAFDRVETIASAQLEREPHDMMANYYVAWNQWLRDENEEAAERIFPWLDQIVDAERRERFRRLYGDAMLDAGRAVDAHQILGGDRDSFAHLAEQLTERFDVDQLAQLIEDHRRQDPDDPDLGLWLGKLHLDQGRTSEGADELKAWLASGRMINPSVPVHQWYVMAMHEAGRGEELLATETWNNDLVEQLASLLDARGDYDGLRELMNASGERAAELPSRDYFAARLLYEDGEYDACIEQALAALGKRDDEYPGREQYLLLDACLAAGQSPRGYASSPFRDRAFHYLAARHRDAREADQLRRLLEEVEQDDPTTSLLDHFRGELAALEEDWDAAIAAMRRELNRGNEDYGSWQTRMRLIELLDESGRWREALETLESPEVTFSQIARRMFDQSRVDDLSDLIEFGERLWEEPDEEYDGAQVSLELWRAQRDYLLGDFGSAWRRHETHRDEIAESLDAWKVPEWRVSILVRLDRLDEALAEAERWVEEDEYDAQTQLIFAAVCAARNDIPRVLEALEASRDLGCTEAEMYDHELLGELLRADTLKAVRETFPPPDAKR